MVISRSVCGPLCVLAGFLIFSTNGLWMVLAPMGANPYTLSAFRMCIGAGAMILLLCLARKNFSFDGWNWRAVLCYSIGTWAYQLFFYNAILKVGIAVGTVISVGSTPIFTGLLQWLLSKKMPDKVWFLATFLAIIGVILLNSVSSLEIQNHYLIIPILAGFFSGLSMLTGPSVTRDRDPQVGAALSALIISLLMVPFFFFFPIGWVTCKQGLTCVLVLGLVNTALGYLLIFKGFESTKPVVAASLTLAEPMGATLIGIVFLGERCTWTSILGIVFILSSVLLLVTREAKA